MNFRALCTLCLTSLILAEDLPKSYEVPSSIDGAIFWEPFQSDWNTKWTVSKDAEFTGAWNHEIHHMDALPGDKGLVVGNPAKKHAVATVFDKPVVAKEAGGLVIQYELQLKKGLECGGAYLKLLTASDELSLDGFKNDTPYTIMFGPDKCGGTNKVHFILRHKNPVSGVWEEKHMSTPPVPITTDKLTHMYTAVISADNTVKIYVDGEEKTAADLMSSSDFTPPVNPSKEIDDPSDSKPEDWVDLPKIDDPTATKPEDWDEEAPMQIPDPKVSKPSAWMDDEPLEVPDSSASPPPDWDEDEDGEWEPPMIPNPLCKKAGCGEWKTPMISNPDFKGKWYPPKIDNPEYIGEWSPRQIENPHYFFDESPYAVAPIGGIGIELWTMQDGILFDNILVASDPAVATEAAQGFHQRKKLEEEVNKEEQRKQALNAGGDGSWASVKRTAKKAMFYVQDNPVPVALAVCLGILPLFFFLCCRGKKRSPAGHSVPAPAATGSSAAPAATTEDMKSSAADDDEPPVIEEIKPAKEAKPAKKRVTKKVD